jgi:PleD family two-component response regulator
LVCRNQTIEPLLQVCNNIKSILNNFHFHLFIIFIRDITKRKAYEEKLEHLSSHDALTGLYNRTFYETELERLAEGMGVQHKAVMQLIMTYMRSIILR